MEIRLLRNNKTKNRISIKQIGCNYSILVLSILLICFKEGVNGSLNTGKIYPPRSLRINEEIDREFT